MYVLDSLYNPVLVGVAGELYVGGDGLSSGYFNRPEITAEKFVPNPFSESGGDRLYKTGDLVRWLADGSIEFMGRVDRQVKIRGLRIEPGEIAAMLATHADVCESVVLVREDLPGDRRLIAYFTTNTTTDISALRDYLKERLPNYMIPSAFVQMDSFPVTPNGKTDFRAFPAPANDLTVSASFVAPQNQLEESIAQIWQQVLGLQAVGTQDNFFDAGGNSLSLIQVQGRLQETLQREIPVVDLFQYATIQGLAQRLSQQNAVPESAKAEVRPEKLAQGSDRLKLLRQKTQRPAKGTDEE
jgi:non-ribosomal peptide synthetase component F